VGGIFKIIAEVLANKFRLVLEKIISKSQNTFIRGSQVLDHVPIAIKCIDSIIRSRELGVLCKLDIEKAYGHVSWHFLYSSLYLFGSLFCFGRQHSYWCFC
jgi:hypothetical protein